MPAKDQGFSEDQIEDFKEVFQLFDTKGDGLIQVRVFLLALLPLVVKDWELIMKIIE